MQSMCESHSSIRSITLETCNKTASLPEVLKMNKHPWRCPVHCSPDRSGKRENSKEATLENATDSVVRRGLQGTEPTHPTPPASPLCLSPFLPLPLAYKIKSRNLVEFLIPRCQTHSEFSSGLLLRTCRELAGIQLQRPSATRHCHCGGPW